MKNLNLLWNQLFTSLSSDSGGGGGGAATSKHSRASRGSSRGKAGKFLNRFIYGHGHHHHHSHYSRRQQSEPPPRSLSYSSCSSEYSASSEDSARSYSPGKVTQAFLERHDRQQKQQQQRAASYSHLARSVSLEPTSNHYLLHRHRHNHYHNHSQHQREQPQLNARYQHPKFCQCNICLLHSQLQCHDESVKLNHSAIGIIREETEDEDGGGECRREAVNRPERRKGKNNKNNNNMDKIVPFQKPEKLQNLQWQAPAAALDEQPDVIKRIQSRSEAGDRQRQRPLHRQYSDNMSKLSVPTVIMYDHRDHRHSRRSPSPPPDYIDNEGRCRSSASNFIRTHQLRSSCPPPSRPRRRSKTPSGRSLKQSTTNNTTTNYSSSGVQLQPNYSQDVDDHGPSSYHHYPHHHERLSQQNSHSTSGLVDKVKKLGSVRKSWLFSLFQPNSNATNSKEKQSKWAKSDDFEAEFFDPHRELTESLITRRSPLMFGPAGAVVNDSNRSTANLHHGMTPHAASEQPPTVRRNSVSQHHRLCSTATPQQQQQLLVVPPSNTTTTISDSASNASNSSAGAGATSSRSSSTARPRPLSACLDTYMLRMRNGNFIEFTVDNENQDESCSIISSANVQQHQLIGDYSFPSHLTTSPISENGGASTQQYSTTASDLTTASASSSSVVQRREPHPPNQRRPASIVSDIVSHHNSSHWLQPPSTTNTVTATMTSTVTSNSSSILSSSASPSLPKRNSRYPTTATTTPTTTTTTSSISSTSSGIQMAPWSSSSPSAHSSAANLRLLANHSAVHIYWPVRNFTEISIGPGTTALDVITHFLTSQLYAKVPGSSSTPNSPTRTAAAAASPSQPTRYLYSYALRLVCRSLNPNDCQWLHPSHNVQQFLEQNRALLQKGWTLELRIRFLPPGLQQLFVEDFVTFKFLYEQVLDEFLMLDLPSSVLTTYQDLIIELGCLELRRSNPYLTPQGLEKSSNFEALEAELHKFLPSAFIASVKSKHLRKLIKNKYKKIFAIQHKNAMFEFFRLVPQFVNYRREVFHCSLGESLAWRVPIDLTIGPDIGMEYFTSNTSPPTVIVKTFDQIEQISIVSHATMNRSAAAAAGDKSKSQSSSDDATNTGPTKKILLNIRIRNEDDILVISCPSFSVAQSIADLLDGYHRLVTNTAASIWLSSTSDNESAKGSSGQNSLKSNCSESIEPRRAEIEFITPHIASPQHAILSHGNLSSVQSSQKSLKSATDEMTARAPIATADEEGDYSNPVEMCTEICREKLRIDKLIGTGQFGDVHQGVYYPPTPSPSTTNDSQVSMTSNKEAEPIPVAIKISRIQGANVAGGAFPQHATFDYFSADQKLLCEAERMHHLEHANIIKLIGVCSASPVYVVMELAQYGELRDFLQKHGSALEHRALIEYSIQISSALSYLESKQFVHRDIAARNILVFSFECVKLADFGLSRYIEDASYYMATNSKLPIKWMAPESINFRRFTTASDVWMFAVCMWEIFMLGKKPFQGVKNADVIGLIESGERLTKPSRCPEPLYQLMLKAWRYEPDKRPSFRYVKHTIKAAYENELGLVGAIARMDLSQSSPKSSLSSLSGYNDKYNSSSSASSSLSRNYALSSKKTAATGSFENNLSHEKSNSSLNASSQAMNAVKIKEILSEQRKQMEEDSKWLAQNEHHWHPKGRFDSLNSARSSELNYCSEHDSTATSVYEDADCGAAANGKDSAAAASFLRQQSSQSLNKSDQHLYSVPNPPTGKHSKRTSYGDESYNSNSFKSTTSLMASGSSGANSQQHTPSTSSIDSTTNTPDYCGLSVSLKKFFKHNQLTDSTMRQEMMRRINYTSANIDRSDDTVYRGTISVINSVRHLLKGVQEVNTSDYVDLVKDVGQELRNLLANVDTLVLSLPEEAHWSIGVAQKKLTSDMNDLVEAMKKAILHSETPMEETYKQSMLETTYVLVIDSKNLLDTLDEVRIRLRTNIGGARGFGLSDEDDMTTDTAVESQSSNKETSHSEEDDAARHRQQQQRTKRTSSQQQKQSPEHAIYANDGVQAN